MRTLTPDPREGKLPKWARDLLARERAARVEAQLVAEQARLASDPDGSSAVLERYDNNGVGLGRNANVSFRVGGPEDWTRQWIDVHADRGGGIRVHGDRGIVVEPVASNTVRIRVEGP